MSYRTILLLILGIDALTLLFQTTRLSISYDEAKLLYGGFSVLGQIVQFSLHLFGNNDFALRLPMIFFHTMSAVLMYMLGKNYNLDERNRLWLVLSFVLLPGVVSSAIVVNSAGLVIFGLLLFLVIYFNFPKIYSYILLCLLSFVEQDFNYLFFSLILYSLYTKDKYFFLLNTTLYICSLYIFGIDIKDSIPSGHFLDTLGAYSAIFTPIIFIYLIYTLYRVYLTKKIDLLWFISTSVFAYTLILSFRQRTGVEHYAPYLIIALPLAAKTFYSAYRVRLKMFRKGYRNIFILSLLFLVSNSLIVFFNKELYIFLSNPKKNFAYEMHIAKELAQTLKNKNIYAVTTDKKMQLRLKFYGIRKSEKIHLHQENLTHKSSNDVTLSYNNKVVYNASVTYINKE